MTIWSRPNFSIQDVSLLSQSALGAQLSSSSSTFFSSFFFFLSFKLSLIGVFFKKVVVYM